MMATSFHSDNTTLWAAWTRLAHALMFDPLRRDEARPQRPRNGRSCRLLDRLDHWFWREAQREREAYLGGAGDIYEVERRMRKLERSPASWYG